MAVGKRSYTQNNLTVGETARVQGPLQPGVDRFSNANVVFNGASNIAGLTEIGFRPAHLDSGLAVGSLLGAAATSRRKA